LQAGLQETSRKEEEKKKLLYDLIEDINRSNN